MGVYQRFFRCFAAGATFLLALAQADAASQKKIVADFEDFGTWRMKESSGLKPGAWWPVEVGLAGSDAAKGRNDLVGELKFVFGPAGAGPFSAGFERAKMAQASGFLDGIEWEANANNQPVSLRFQIQDASNKIFTTKPVPLTGEGWRHYRIDLGADTLPGFANCKFPARLRRVTVDAAAPCEGSVFLDDLAITGRFAKRDRLSITPVYEKIAYLPGEEVTLRYRVRNVLPEAVSGTLRIVVKDFHGKELLAKEAPFSAEAAGSAEVSFPAGKFPLGAYEAALTAKAGELELKEQDHFVVMVPNAGRPNKHPMWFGIADQTSWQGDLENRRHLEWMRLLGADIDRVQIFADRFEPEEGVINEPGWRKLLQGHADAGVDIMVLYSDTPKWAHTAWKWRTPPDLGDKFETHARHLGAFLKQFPNVTYLEFWNEPDLDFFEGTLDQYLEMFAHFSKGLKEAHPSLLLTSGGVAVQHPHEKPGFSKGMYQRAGGLYDVAAYHAHGPLINTEVRHAQVVEWLKEAGLGDKRIFNTETGERSLYTADGRRRQAITLVKKVVYSKSLPNFDAYFWFTLQDYWDMDPEADDSFGLITSDNRAKPSFAAYNTLIRQLANTAPLDEAPRAPDLSLFAFRRDDGRFVYVAWPVETKSSAILWIKTPQEMEVSDLFGNTRRFAPLGGILPVSIGELPVYLSGASPSEPIRLCPPGEEFLRVPAEVRFADARKTAAIPVRLHNPAAGDLEGALVLRDARGAEIAKKPFQIPTGRDLAWDPEVIPERFAGGPSLRLDLNLHGRQGPAFTFPVRLIASYAIRKVPDLAGDPSAWPGLDGVAPLVIDRAEQVFELAYDPTTPAWKGPEDLSAAARLVHDGRGIRFQITVTDDATGPAPAKDRLWSSDDVQVAFGRADAKKFTILDLGESAEGPAVWCSEHENPGRIGEWKVPLSIKREGNVTVYDVYLPIEKLGLSPDDKNIRFTFTVNENDGKGRVRWIEWTPGIARDRSIESLGYGSLE
jgi:hypothetical protein